MKKSYLFNRILLLFFMLAAVSSCSKEEAEQEQTPEPEVEDLPESITLITDLSGLDILVGETVNFEITGSDGKDYSSKAKVYLKGEIVSGNSYQFERSGEFIFHAEYREITSSSIKITAHDIETIPPPQSLTLSADKESGSVDINEQAILTVMGNNGLEYTSLSTITLNGKPITGNRHTFTEGGEHLFLATFESINSNTIEFNVNSGNYIAISDKKILRSEEVIFDYFGPNGEQMTDKAIFYVNGTAVSGNSFSSSIPGTYEVYAISETEEPSNIKTFEVFVPIKKLLFEDYTGTWCGWCPRVTNAILELKDRTDDIVVVAHHVHDEMEDAQTLPLVSYFKIEYFPHARYDRTFLVEFPEDDPDRLTELAGLAGQNSPYSIAINTSLEGDNLTVEVALKGEEEIPQGYKIITYLLQNDLVFPQDNYLNDDPESRWYQKGDPIPDFVHDEVFEFSLTPIMGSELQRLPPLEKINFTYNQVDLSQFKYIGNYYNPNNFEIVAFLTDENNTVLNAQKVKAGQSKVFE